MDMIPQGMEVELATRTERIAAKLRENGIDALLVSDNANLYYTSGRVYSGYTYITADGDITYFVRRPVGLSGASVRYIRKPEQIAEIIGEVPQTVALELDLTSYSDIMRLGKVFAGSKIANASPLLRQCRAVKSEFEIDKIRQCGVHHDAAYSCIPGLYVPGMTDVEFQIEIERALRLEGCLGQFRVSGGSMEIFMGNVISGENADTPSPYDFTMGGAGLSTSLPVGCSGRKIEPGQTVMVDMCGNFNGYMTDMTRTYSVGEVGELARSAHQVSIEMARRIAVEGRAGVEAKTLYSVAVEMAEQAGLGEYFMGYTQKAGFIGHGVGIEINEAPVLAPRSRDILQQGNIIALEPKFVIPHVGAVGIENTYVVRADGLECLTNCEESLTAL